MGRDPYATTQILIYFEDFQNKVFNYQPTDVVEKLTGRPAEDIDTTVRRYFEQSGNLEATMGGKMKAMKTFMEIAMSRAPTTYEMQLMNQS